MRPFAVDLVLLRATAPDLPLVVGRVLAARVVDRHDRHGVINLAGAYLTAELPDDVQVGDRLRLVVQGTSGDKAVLALAGPPGQTPPPLAEPPLADDRIELVGERPAESAPEDVETVAVRVESATLGPIDLRVSLAGELVHVRAALDAGEPLALARTRAMALRAALAQAAGRPAEVDVVARPERVDVYG